MSSINDHYTFQYSQPSEYRFSHDSVFLARHVFERLKNLSLESYRILDLCAGCGVVGLDFLFHCENELGLLPTRCDFIEIQSEYLAHFSVNAQRFSRDHIHFINSNYECLLSAEFFRLYDLIICNPPYFQVTQGKLSPSEFKNRCRFYMDSDFATLLRGIENSLRPGGIAFVLMRDLSDHGLDVLAEARGILSAGITLRVTGEVRGTTLIELQADPSKS